MTSQRKKTAPPTPKHPRSSPVGRKGLIAKEKTKKQSERKRTALDNRFHRTAYASAATSAASESWTAGPPDSYFARVMTNDAERSTVT